MLCMAEKNEDDSSNTDIRREGQRRPDVRGGAQERRRASLRRRQLARRNGEGDRRTRGEGAAHPCPAPREEGRSWPRVCRRLFHGDRTWRGTCRADGLRLQSRSKGYPSPRRNNLHANPRRAIKQSNNQTMSRPRHRLAVCSWRLDAGLAVQAPSNLSCRRNLHPHRHGNAGKRSDRRFQVLEEDDA